MQLPKEFQEPYEEKKGYKLLPPGTYPFTVESAKLHTSERGNLSIMVQLSFVKNDDFSFKVTVFDYLTANPAWKFRSFLRAVGLEELEKHPTIDPYQLIGASGIAKLRIQKSEEYDDRNTVQNYKIKKGVAKAVPVASPPEQTQQQKEATFITQAETITAAEARAAAAADDDCPFEVEK